MDRERRMMARGWFTLSHELLKQVLCLPDDAEIVAVAYIGRTTCAVWVEHKDIPEPKDNIPAELSPVFETDYEHNTTVVIKWAENLPLATLDVMEHNHGK